MALSSSTPPLLRFVQGFLPVFLFVLIYWNWRHTEPPWWLLALIFVLLVLGTLLVTRILWAIIRRADTIDDGHD